MPLRGLVRRTVLSGALTAAVWRPGIAAAQARPRRIGVIRWEEPGSPEAVEDIRRSLLAVGYREGVNVTFEWRWAHGSRERAARAAAELEASDVDLIYAFFTPTVHAIKDVVKRTPIVFYVADALSTGIVGNMTRPGGLLTGVMTLGPELASKRLEILAEAIPGVSRIGFLSSSVDPNSETFVRETIAAATPLGISVAPVAVRGAAEFESAMERLAAERVQAVVIQSLFATSAGRAVAPALRLGIPAVGDQVPFAEAGALFAFGAERSHLFDSAAAQIDLIFRGRPPGDIPVQGPTRFRLILNRKTARALGLNLPASLLIRADEVIE